MSEDLFASEFVSVPRQKGECTADGTLVAAGYKELLTTERQAGMLYDTYKISPWCAHRVFQKEGRTYMFEKWAGQKDESGWSEPNAVIIRDVTALLKESA